MKSYLRKIITIGIMKMNKRNFCFQINSLSPLIEIAELKELMDKNLENIKIIDSTWFPPEEKLIGETYFKEKRIAKSQFFDINGIVDKSSKLPNMLPSNQFFCEKMKEMDIRIDDIIICYDHFGIFSSPRVWFNFKIFGAKNVYVLNGGIQQCEQGNVEIETLNKFNKHFRITPPNDMSYNYKRDDSRIINLERVFEISEGICRRKDKRNILDLRNIVEEESMDHNNEKDEINEKEEMSKGFDEAQINEIQEKELKNSQNNKAPHRQIAGSLSISFTEFLKKDKSLKSKEDLLQIFEEQEIDINKETTFYCDYGISACVGILAFELLGKKANLYDGSWVEYGNVGDNEYFQKYRDRLSKVSANELTDQYFDSLPKDQRIKIEMQRMMIAKTKELDKVKREMMDKKFRNIDDDYDISDNLY